nr:ATG8-interacting protein 2-like [Ipomoea batatas]
MVNANYFSIDFAERYVGNVASTNGKEAGSKATDNPSWIDPGLETRYLRKDSEKWVFSEKEKIGGGFDGIEEIRGGNKNFWSDSGGIEMGRLKIEQFEESKELGVEGDANLDDRSQVLNLLSITGFAFESSSNLLTFCTFGGAMISFLLFLC